ncbi:uncharacterized protein (TIGR00297 family) [Aneurinibacillus soli]|uniref:Uncharacterized protein n=1 Tax=Aneurinibacillus soli TaxID=1500254 RepID=A0A0U5BDJ1_9BACL|nr:DUF92 domain-containing protein [Aneurinibacillus soli]PYE62906.1 uncharacterized protein (TIGR00297 family) [Aneurinibacillus soli]BAU29036.1 hypothetical protein CB4_03214 [Aneurinibacillus soli]
MEERFLFGLIGSVLIAGIAYKKRSLSVSGGIAAIMLGTALYTFGDVKWYGLLLAFFISSSWLSHRKKQEKREVESLFAKTGVRDWLQVAANGGLGLVAVLGAFLSGRDDVWFAFYIGVLAAAASDTWATEIGVLSRRPPRHILTGRVVTSGTSGGISRLGLVASLAGGAFIGAAALLLTIASGGEINFTYVWLGAVGGLAGSLADSVLGATWQRTYECAVCRKETERAVHCGAQTHPLKGYAWCTNDVVNIAGTIVGGVVAVFIHVLAVLTSYVFL